MTSKSSGRSRLTRAQRTWQDLAKQAKGKKPSKYRNRKTRVGDLVFDSAKEAARYQILKRAELAGYIMGLEIQPVYDLREQHGAVVSRYRADFAYWQKNDGHIQTGNPPVPHLTYTVEDVKGFKTATYRLKKKHFIAQYGYRFLET